MLYTANNRTRMCGLLADGQSSTSRLIRCRWPVHAAWEEACSTRRVAEINDIQNLLGERLNARPFASVGTMLTFLRLPTPGRDRCSVEVNRVPPRLHWLRRRSPSRREAPNLTGMIGFDGQQACRSLKDIRVVDQLAAPLYAGYPTSSKMKAASRSFFRFHRH